MGLFNYLKKLIHNDVLDKEGNVMTDEDGNVIDKDGNILYYKEKYYDPDFYDEDGNLKEVEEGLSYLNGELINNKLLYGKESSEKSTWYYDNKKITGELIEYYKSGKIKSKENYKDGLGVGEDIDYYENGQIDEINNHDTGEFISYYENGNLKEKGKYNKDGSPIGHWSYYNEDGTLDFEENND